MPRKIQVKLFDYDECLSQSDKGCQSLLKPDKPHEWLLEDNQALFDYLAEEIEVEQPDQIIIGQGSARDDHYTDCLNINAHKSGSATATPPIIQSYFASRVNCDVVLDPFSLADAFRGYQQAGDSYKASLKAHRADKQHPEKVQHTRCMKDINKITKIYAHAHRVATLNPDADIMLDLYDDRDDILDQIHEFYTKNKNLLPNNVTLRLRNYAGAGGCRSYDADLVRRQFAYQAHRSSARFPLIQGEGETDTRYIWSLRYMGATLSANPTKITTAAELRRFHEKGDYLKGQGHLLNFTPDWPAQFLAFRDGEKEQLAPECANPQATGYTTATALYRAGLIPKEYDMQAAHLEQLKKGYDDLLRQLETKYKELFLKAGKAFRAADEDGNDETYLRYREANHAAVDIYNALKKAADDYFEHGKINYVTFKQRSTAAINSRQKQILEQHRGFSPLLANILLAIGTLGVGYLVSVAVESIITQSFNIRFFRYKTDSAKKVDAIAAQLQRIAP